MITVKDVILSGAWNVEVRQLHAGNVEVKAERKFFQREGINDFRKIVSFKYVDRIYKEYKGKSVKDTPEWRY